jgi:hypothetical protein
VAILADGGARLIRTSVIRLPARAGVPPTGTAIGRTGDASADRIGEDGPVQAGPSPSRPRPANPSPPGGPAGPPTPAGSALPGEPAEPTESRPAGRSARSPRDMALALLVLLVPIFVLLAAYRWAGGESPTVVDTSSAYDTARAARLFPVSEPSGLPAGWQAAGSAFQRGDAGAVLRVGFRTPKGGTAQLIESDVPADNLVTGELGGGARMDGTTAIHGREWQVYTTGGARRALVLRQPDRTVIVVGEASPQELSALADALG